MNFPINLNKNEKPNRRSIRLKDYNYSQAGAYYMTICTHNRECLFGQIDEGEIELNEQGQIVQAEWYKTAQIRPNLAMDEFIVMPNHIHGIIFINNPSRGTMHRAPTPIVEQFGKPVSNSLPTIIRGFKSAVTTRIKRIRNTYAIPVWQRNYYEHIIRNEIDLEEIRKYIQTNPLKWLEDENHPAHMEKLNCGRGSTNRFTQLPPITI
jgi:putative transposase